MAVNFSIFSFMKILFSILFFFFAAFCAAAGPVSFYGELKASNSGFRGSNTNKLMQIKGVSFFWSQWEDGFAFYNENAVDRMAQDWKAEVVRAAYGSTSEPFSSETAATNRERIETIVDAAIKNDIYVIIDWHSHAAHNEAETERAKDFFSYFAQKYGNLDNVIFEIYNEPTNTTWPGIKAYAEKVIPVIREYSDNLILVGTPNWDQNIETVIGNNITSHTNIGYVLHFYAATHSLISFETKVKDVLNARLPVFVSEFGTTDADGGNPNACVQTGETGCIKYENHYDSHSVEKTDQWIEFLDKWGISYVAWSISDKYEGSAFFGATRGERFNQTVPENWTNTGFMTASGAYIFNMLRESHQKAAWTPVISKGIKPLKHELKLANGRVFVNMEKGGNVRLEAYSLNGVLAKTVFNGYLEAGEHQFSLGLPNGAVILRLISQKNTQN
jgi:endoglucanase